MRLNTKNSGWYTIIMATLMIGFLLIFVWWVLNLVIKELKDNRGEINYIKAYAAAEWAQELALLKIKENGYWYYEKVENKSSEANAIILAEDPKDSSKYKKSKDLLISYDLGSKTKEYFWKLSPAWDEILPLFTIKLDWSFEEVGDLKLEIITGNDSNLGWTITSWNWSWIWGNWDFDKNTLWRWRKANADFIENKVWDFLTSNNWNYLLIFSIDPTSPIEYKITSTKAFTKPKTEIISSAQVWDYKQNLKTSLDNSKFLNILKYSIFSK
jgi:hypothetical protein